MLSSLPLYAATRRMSSYVVIFKNDHASLDDAIASAASTVTSSGGEIKHNYTMKSMKGFAGTMSEEVRKELEKNPAVKYVEPDGPVSTQ